MSASVRPIVLTCQANERDRNPQRAASRPARKTRSDGERSRSAILREAARLATVEGIDGLSIGRLAEAVGMSKSGLFAHFRSKEELQLATIETASALFARARGRARAATRPDGVRAAPRPRRELPRGTSRTTCSPAAASSRPSRRSSTRARARCATARSRSSTSGRRCSSRPSATRRPRARSTASEDAEQLAFELDAYLLLANAQYVISAEPAALDRARRAIERRLAAAAPDA